MELFFTDVARGFGFCFALLLVLTAIVMFLGMVTDGGRDLHKLWQIPASVLVLYFIGRALV